VPIFGAYIWCLCCWIGIGDEDARLFWSLYLEPIEILEPIFGAFIWSLYLEPLFGSYIWSLYLEPPALARVVPFFGICSKAPNKGTKWCLYLVPSWLGALLSGAFLKTRCSVKMSSLWAWLVGGPRPGRRSHSMCHTAGLSSTDTNCTPLQPHNEIFRPLLKLGPLAHRLNGANPE
jgi:hypothetical protein